MARPAFGYCNKDGKKIPGSTTVLKGISTMDSDILCNWAAKCAREGKDWKAVRRQAGEHGTALHELCETKLPNALTEEDRPASVSDVVLKGETLSAWAKLKLSYEEIRKWYVEHEPKIIFAEEPMVSEAFQFAGTPDAVWTFPKDKVFDAADGTKLEVPAGAAVLGDYKTGGMVGAKEIAQMSSYRQLLKENGICEVVGSILIHAPTKQPGYMRPVVLTAKHLDTAWAKLFLSGLAVNDALEELQGVCA